MRERLSLGITCFISGIILCGIIAYAGVAYLAKDISYKNTNVEEALNDLYEKAKVGSAATVNLNISSDYQLTSFVSGITYEAEDTSTLTVNSSGLISVLKKGTTIINVIKDDKIILKYNVITKPNNFLLLEAKCASVDQYMTATEAQLKEISKLLTDGSKIKNTNLGSLFLDRSASIGETYVKFKLVDNSSISFSSGSFSDGEGSSGGIVDFYKIDSNNNQTLYYSLTQLDNSIDYGEHVFEAGTYIAKQRNSGKRYVTFEEWNIYVVE